MSIFWNDLTTRVEAALLEIQMPGLFGPTGVNPKMAAKVATDIIREDVDAYIASIPRVPTTKYDAMITIGGFAALTAAIGGFGYLMYKLDQNNGLPLAPPEPAPEPKTDK